MTWDPLKESNALLKLYENRGESRRRSSRASAIMTVDALELCGMSSSLISSLFPNSVTRAQCPLLLTRVSYPIPKVQVIDEDSGNSRAPKKDDVTKPDLKNIIPSGGITCLVAKQQRNEAVLNGTEDWGMFNFKNINNWINVQTWLLLVAFRRHFKS
ncbi:hypothetical protein Tco_0987335 [Tanacetum coccineum]